MSRVHVLPIAIASAVLATAPAASAASAKCKLLKLGELPVTMTGLQPVVPVKINGLDARLMADTGAFFSMLTPAAATRLGVKSKNAMGGVSVVGVGGFETMQVGTAKDFSIDGIAVKKVDFLIGGRNFGPESDGVLGQNMLGGVEIEYDLANGVLRLFRAKDCKGDDVIAYWATEKAPNILPISLMTSMDRQITAMGKINGKPIKVMFDTGSSRSVVERASAERLGIRRDAPGVTSGGAIQGIGRRVTESWIAPVDSFEIGDESVQRTSLRIAEIDMSNADMVIGADFFLSHRVMISSSQHKLYFTYNGGPVFRLDRTSETPSADEAGPAPTASAGPAAQGAAKAGEPADAAGYSRRGAASMARRDFPAAIADFSKAIELEPKTAQHYLGRAIAKLNAGQPVLAMADLSEALKLKPDDRDARMIRGQLYLVSRDLPSATADFDVAMKQAPADAMLRMRVGQIYVGAGQFETGIAEYDQAIAAMPKDAQMWRALNARCWARALWGKELDKALADCNAALRQGPKASNMLDSRGLVHLRLNHLDEAIADYDDAIRLQPKAAWSLYGRGLAKQRKGLKAEGDADLAAAVAIDPKLPAEIKRYGIGG